MLGRIGIDLNQDSNYDRRLKVGIKLALEHKAQIVGIYTSLLTKQYLYGGDTALPSQARAILETAIDQQMTTAKESFLQQTGDAGVAASWRAPKGEALEALALHSRFCDILIMSHIVESTSMKNLLPYRGDSIITSAGRPVLVVPHADALPTLGKSVLICWDSSHRAARALSDAAPFLERASKVIALSVNLNKEMLETQDVMPDDLSAYCASHHYPELTEVHMTRPKNEIGEAILAAANDYDCDLIVMGAYSHSPLREWTFGGTSTTLLQSMRVPVLFSH